MSNPIKPTSNGNGNGKLDLKTVSLIIAVVGGVASPFIAIGGFRERVMVLEKRADASESEMHAHENYDTQKEISWASTLATIQESLKNQSNKLDSIQASQAGMWQAIRQFNKTQQ